MKIHRYLAPTAALVSWADIFRGCFGLVWGRRYRAKLEAELKQYFGIKHVFLFSSGKVALATTIRALSMNSSRRKVLIPAYTCFTVPSAVIRGGGQVALCDVDPRTLDFVFDDLKRALDRETLCVVVPHLLGQRANLERVRDIAAAHGAVVVEDAAQAMGVKDGEHFLGTKGDVGFFSLGRGKNLSAGSGGILLTQSEKIAEAVQAVIREMPEVSPPERVLNLATMAAMKLLIHPRLYWLPAGMPFLGLGETHFDLDFPMQRLDGVRAGLLRAWRQRLVRSNEQRASKGQAYESALSTEARTLDPGRSKASMFLRFPLVLPKAEQKSRLCSQAEYKRLGVSGLYPSTISEIPQLQSAFEGRRFPGAKALAERLVTFPVHHYVEPRDVQTICRVVGNMIQSVTPAVQSQSMVTQIKGQRRSLVRL